MDFVDILSIPNMSGIDLEKIEIKLIFNHKIIKKIYGLVGINQHIYLLYDFHYLKLNLIDPSDGKTKV